MALQRVTITVEQKNSGGPITVNWQWTSDEYSVDHGRLYMRQNGAFTLDRRMVQDLEASIVGAVRSSLDNAQLF